MAKNKLYFNTLAAALLYDWELSGQISDGKYENSRPYDHWRWVIDAEIIVDPNGLNYTTRMIRKTYNLNEWVKYMNGTETWAWRCAQFVRFGNCFESTQENYDLISQYVSRSAVERLKESYPSYDAFVEDCKHWPDYAESGNFLKVFTEEVYNKYYSVEISTKEFTKYHKLMKETVNRCKEDAELEAKKAEQKAAEKEAAKEAKKAAKKAEAEAKKAEFIKKSQEVNTTTQVTSATTEDDLIAPQNKVSTLELKLAAIKFLKEKYGVDVKELNVKL